jgi:cytochrome c2
MVLIAFTAAPVAAAGDKVKGEKVYKDAKCSVCHKVGSTGGKMGPELTKVGTTRDLAWLSKYLVNPKAENPKNKMPPVKAKGADLDDLIAYLLSLK